MFIQRSDRLDDLLFFWFVNIAIPDQIVVIHYVIDQWKYIDTFATINET